MRVPYVNLSQQHAALEDELLEATRQVLRHGWFILGPEVKELEQHFAHLLEVPHTVGVNSGTDALVLALKLHGVGEGDEVITVSHSFVATASAVCLVGATPVFVDIDPETMLMDPARLEGALTPRTRAVMPVHLNGFPCDMEPIAAFCEAHGLALIEDCAQSIGAMRAGKPVGSFGTGCFSLHPLKVLSACGDAGFLTAHSDVEAETLHKLRNLGLRHRDSCQWVSGNSRLDTLQAALLLVKFKRLEAWIEARNAHARAYREALEGVVRLPPREGPGDRAVYSTFVVRHPERERVIAALSEAGIDAKIHYPYGIHQHEAFAHLEHGPLPVTEEVVRQIISLPVTPEMTEAQREHVIATLNAVA
ncbi:MAG: cell wall biogenesis protein [Myxococcales bacterium]|nr:cell wall biogenesis protein [Myxococcales bacterium]